MQITTRHEYQATPQQVIAMMADERWLEEVARRANAQTWEVAVNGATSHVTAELAAPEKVRRFVGSALRIELDITWGAADAAGKHDGDIKVEIPGMPAKMSGAGTMMPTALDGAEGTVVEYTAEFTISIPLVGKSLEQAAAPYVTRVIDMQQEVGNDYLAGKLS
ncbi:DUF2505 domain-containing protein [Propionibacterium sp. oral taxon 192]|uniref:DUF2505 domain-containing protein n=1 Tax=Propionibacterium sp. oral taxon 192 TaxID=671222 RepID=UPI000559CCC0|nr:DUF2505 domain-containing protein [Propionibacterium sp. oral taxon 192]